MLPSCFIVDTGVLTPEDTLERVMYVLTKKSDKMLNALDNLRPMLTKAQTQLHALPQDNEKCLACASYAACSLHGADYRCDVWLDLQLQLRQLECKANMLEKLRNRSRRKLELNTHLEMDDDLVITLHGTQIIRFLADGRIQLNSGGWQTNTTKDRINMYSPFTIRQKKGTWYIIDIPGGDILFKDYMIL